MNEPRPGLQDTAACEDDGRDLVDDDRELPIHQLCQAWAAWAHARNQVRMPKGEAAPAFEGPPMVACGEDLAALHLAIVLQPDAIDRQVFERYYLGGTGPIKQLAAELGISRQHFHRLLSGFRGRVYSASRQLLTEPGGRDAALTMFLQLLRERDD